MSFETTQHKMHVTSIKAGLTFINNNNHRRDDITGMYAKQGRPGRCRNETVERRRPLKVQKKSPWTDQTMSPPKDTSAILVIAANVNTLLKDYDKKRERTLCIQV